MAARKDVFISATSADLGSYRQVVKEALLTLGAHPIEQSNFPTDYRELQGVLTRVLDPCDAVVHLAGFYYGGATLRLAPCADLGRNGNTTAPRKASSPNPCTVS